MAIRPRDNNYRKGRRDVGRTVKRAAISLVIVLLAGLYTWQSLAFWKGYEARLVGEQQQYQVLRNEALSGKTTESRLTAIRTLDDKLKKRGELCRVSYVYSWQSIVIPQLREGVKKCEDKARQLGRLAVPLSALREYLEASEKVQDILKNLNPGEALKEGNWNVNGLERAKKAVNDLKTLSVTGDGAKLKDQAAGLAKSLESTWQSLIKANDVKDKTAFIAASAAVTKAYADFMGLADLSDAQLQEKVQALTTTANSI